MMTADSPDTIIISQPLTPYLCLGYHQVYDAVLDRAECERSKLPVVRRRLGGGVQYLDANQLVFQCVFHHSRVPWMVEDIYARFLTAPVATLDRLGLSARFERVNEIMVEGQRIADVSGGQIGEASVVTCNLFFDYAYHTMARTWHAPWPSFRELAAAALREHITTIWRRSGPVTIEAVQWMLLEECAKVLERPIERGTPKQAETRLSSEIAARLHSPDYLNLHDENGHVVPLRPLHIAAGVTIHAAEVEQNGRRLRATFRVRDQVIEQAHLESDPAHNWKQVEEDLCGVPHSEWRASMDHQK
jgi:lipoate-protein ligase A